jgi:hypothetical protein
MSLPKPPKEVPINRDYDALAKGFEDRLLLVIRDMRNDGHKAYMGEGFRTRERQAFLEGFGRRYDDGRGIVTKARTPEGSWHAYGTAADIWDNSNPKAPFTPRDPKAFYAALFKACKKHGLTWGGDWDMDGDLTDQRFPDRPHVQDGRLPMSPTAADRADYLAGRTKAVLNRYKIAP